MIFLFIRQVAPKIINLEQRHEGLAEFPQAPYKIIYLKDVKLPTPLWFSIIFTHVVNSNVNKHE